MSDFEIIVGDCRETLKTLKAASVQTCVTSPPYFGLRDYGHGDQIGLEPTPDDFVEAMVEVFREVRRVLRDDGTVWLNLGDSYAGSWGAQSRPDEYGAKPLSGNSIKAGPEKSHTGSIPEGAPYKPRDLIGIPWMVAFALRADGWYLRSDIIWHKPNPMPESVKNRPTRSHEVIFLLSKMRSYYYDADAIREPLTDSSVKRLAQNIEAQAGSSRANGGAKSNGAMKAVRTDKQRGHGRRHEGFNDRWDSMSREEQRANGANKRDVWTVATKPFSGAHFATFPQDLIEPCILAGAPERGLVLDPFTGSGTTGIVALTHGRKFVGCELNPEYAQMARDRITIAAEAPAGMAYADAVKADRARAETAASGQGDLFGGVAA